MMQEAREVGFFEDARHLAEQIPRDVVGFAQLDPGSMQREYRPLGEPADPEGGRGFVGIRNN